MHRSLLPAALLAALLIPAPAHAKGRIAETKAEPEPAGIECARFAVGTGEGELGAHREPGGTIPFGLFNGPTSFAVEGGVVHVLDALNARIVRAPLGGPGPFEKAALPKGALGADLALGTGVYAVADAAGPRVLMLDRLGKRLAAFGGPGDADGLFRQADLVGFDAQGHVLVVDWGRDGLVSRFDAKGLFLGREQPGTAPCADTKDKRLRVEFHPEANQFALFRATAAGETEDALFKMEEAAGGANLSVIGLDRRDRVFLKRFRPPEMEILRLDATGKVETRHPAPADPGFDLSRPYAVDAETGDVYALVFRDGTFRVLKLPPAAARAQ